MRMCNTFLKAINCAMYIVYTVILLLWLVQAIYINFHSGSDHLNFPKCSERCLIWFSTDSRWVYRCSETILTLVLPHPKYALEMSPGKLILQLQTSSPCFLSDTIEDEDEVLWALAEQVTVFNPLLSSPSHAIVIQKQGYTYMFVKSLWQCKLSVYLSVG